jgi:two-component system sensor histidine kinase BaeS
MCSSAACCACAFLAEQEGMSLELATPDRPVFVAADPIALEQALVNVLENAVVHGGQGGRVAALLERTPSGFRLTIVDDGPGVEPDDLPRLFERNFRADGADARHARGGGLGLAITHEVCRRLDYTLTFSREEPSGLRVTITGPSEPSV